MEDYLWGDEEEVKNHIRLDEIKEISLIELTLIQKWLRDEHKIDVTQIASIRLTAGWYQFDITRAKPHVEHFVSAKTYEQALLKGINEALKLVK